MVCSRENEESTVVKMKCPGDSGLRFHIEVNEIIKSGTFVHLINNLLNNNWYFKKPFEMIKSHVVRPFISFQMNTLKVFYKP